MSRVMPGSTRSTPLGTVRDRASDGCCGRAHRRSSTSATDDLVDVEALFGLVVELVGDGAIVTPGSWVDPRGDRGPPAAGMPPLRPASDDVLPEHHDEESHGDHPVAGAVGVDVRSPFGVAHPGQPADHRDIQGSAANRSGSCSVCPGAGLRKRPPRLRGRCRRGASPRPSTGRRRSGPWPIGSRRITGPTLDRTPPLDANEPSRSGFTAEGATVMVTSCAESGRARPRGQDLRPNHALGAWVRSNGPTPCSLFSLQQDATPRSTSSFKKSFGLSPVRRRYVGSPTVGGSLIVPCLIGSGPVVCGGKW